MTEGRKSPRRRQGRAVRDPGREIRLTERDTWILQSLAKLRFATTGQLARLHFGGSRWAAMKRLRKVLDAGLVRVWVRQLSEENVYSLDRAGARLLGETDGQAPGIVPRGLDGNLEHLLAINRVRIALALVLPEAGGELAWWRSDWEIRAAAGRNVVPDALLGIRWQDGAEEAVALEVDNATRSVRRFLGKGLRYRTGRSPGYALASEPRPTVLVVGRDGAWLERYRAALASAGLGVGFWFTTLAELEDRGAAAPIWRPVGADVTRSLRGLAASPYGKEG